MKNTREGIAMRINEIKSGDVLVGVDARGAGYYKVVKTNHKTVDVIAENGNPVRLYPSSFDRKVTYPVAAFHNPAAVLPTALSALYGWLAYAEAELSEFDVQVGGDDCSSESLCPRCQSSGCIALKIQETRAAIRLATHDDTKGETNG
jgi:hypothetical protein